MPPLPSTFDDEAVELIRSIQRRQKDLCDFQIPRLKECQGPVPTQQALAAELREDVEVFARQVEALDVMVDDQRGEKNRRELRGIVTGLQQKLSTLRKESRAALLQSKRNIDSQSQSQREELLRSAVANEKRNPNEKVTDDLLMKTSDDITDALRRTIGAMQGELEKSVLSSQMLDQSTATLRATSGTHDTLTGLMGTSRQLITALEKSDWVDRLIVLSGLAFFFLVVLFILKQRILDRSLRIVFWWTRFIPDFSGDEAALAQMEKGEAMHAAAAAANALASSAAAASATVFSVLSASSSAPPPPEQPPQAQGTSAIEDVAKSASVWPDESARTMSDTSESGVRDEL